LWEFDSDQEVLGKPFADLWPSEERAKIAAAIDFAACGTASNIQAFCQIPRGNRYWCETRFVPSRLESGKAAQIICIGRDFSDRQQGKLTLIAEEIRDREQNALYREIIDSAVETAIIGTDGQRQNQPMKQRCPARLSVMSCSRKPWMESSRRFRKSPKLHFFSHPSNLMH
jgi:hypothetical protein